MPCRLRSVRLQPEALQAAGCRSARSSRSTRDRAGREPGQAERFTRLALTRTHAGADYNNCYYQNCYYQAATRLGQEAHDQLKCGMYAHAVNVRTHRRRGHWCRTILAAWFSHDRLGTGDSGNTFSNGALRECIAKSARARPGSTRRDDCCGVRSGTLCGNRLAASAVCSREFPCVLCGRCRGRLWPPMVRGSSRARGLIARRRVPQRSATARFG